jgi:hypothetical protein
MGLWGREDKNSEFIRKEGARYHEGIAKWREEYKKLCALAGFNDDTNKDWQLVWASPGFDPSIFANVPRSLVLGLLLKFAPFHAELSARRGDDAAPPPLTQRPTDAFPRYSRHRTDVALGHRSGQDEEIGSVRFTDLIGQI